MRKKNYFRPLLAGPYLAWMIAFTIIPLCMVAVYGLTDQTGAFTLENLALIAKRGYFKALLLSLGLSLGSTAVCLLLSYPLAMLLRSRFKGRKSFLVFLFILPMWMNFLLRTLAWRTLLEKNGVINTVLDFLGLPALHIINTPAAIMLGMVYNFLPFMIMPIFNSLTKISDDVINAARDLGANSVQTFFRVIFPLSVPGIISGVTMVFIPALTTFVISDLLGGGKVLLIGNVIEQKFTTANNWHVGAGLSLILMVFILISMLVLNRYDKNGEGNTF